MTRLTRKTDFEICLLIHLLLGCLVVHHDTLRYLGAQRLMSDEEKKNASGRPERLFENLFLFSKFETFSKGFESSTGHFIILSEYSDASLTVF